jgi:hypothetical protein
MRFIPARNAAQVRSSAMNPAEEHHVAAVAPEQVAADSHPRFGQMDVASAAFDQPLAASTSEDVTEVVSGYRGRRRDEADDDNVEVVGHASVERGADERRLAGSGNPMLSRPTKRITAK